MDNQRARVADIGEMRQQFHRIAYGLAGIVATLEAEGEHGPCAFGADLLHQRVAGVFLEACI